MHPDTSSIQPDRVMLTLADIQSNKHLILTHGQSPFGLIAGLADQSGTDGRQPRYDETYPQPGRPCPYQRSLDATKLGDNTPGIMNLD